MDQMPNVITFEQRDLLILRKQFPPELTTADFEFFVRRCERQGVDPFLNQVFVQARWNERAQKHMMVVIVGIDGMRSLAHRTGSLVRIMNPEWCGPDGEWRDVWLKDDEHPYAARVGVVTKGYDEPCYRVARWKAYGAGAQGPVWAKMDDVMLAKCAESASLRAALPDALGGLYSPEEMAQGEAPDEGMTLSGPPVEEEQPEEPKVKVPRADAETTTPAAEPTLREAEVFDTCEQIYLCSGAKVVSHDDGHIGAFLLHAGPAKQWCKMYRDGWSDLLLDMGIPEDVNIGHVYKVDCRVLAKLKRARRWWSIERAAMLEGVASGAVAEDTTQEVPAAEDEAPTEAPAAEGDAHGAQLHEAEKEEPVDEGCPPIEPAPTAASAPAPETEDEPPLTADEAERILQGEDPETVRSVSEGAAAVKGDGLVDVGFKRVSQWLYLARKGLHIGAETVLEEDKEEAHWERAEQSILNSLKGRARKMDLPEPTTLKRMHRGLIDEIDGLFAGEKMVAQSTRNYPSGTPFKQEQGAAWLTKRWGLKKLEPMSPGD